VEAVVGARVRLPCQAETRAEVDWQFRNATHPDLRYIWNRNTMVNGYKQRFVVETNAVGTYNLIISDVQLNDSGIYDCIEDGGFGKIHAVRLRVKLCECHIISNHMFYYDIRQNEDGITCYNIHMRGFSIYVFNTTFV